MILIIEEDGEQYLLSDLECVEPDWFEAAEDGIVDIIDISDPANPVSYFDRKWNPIPKR